MKAINPDGTAVGVAGGWVDGVLMRVAPASPFFDLEIERASATSSVIMPSSSAYVPLVTIPAASINMAGTIYLDRVSNIRTVSYWYRFRHTFPGYATGSYLSGSTGQTPQTYSEQAINQFWKSQASYAATTIDANGTTLTRNVTQYDGVGTTGKKLTKGTQTSLFATHSQVVTYDTPFNDIPVTILQGGLSFQPESKWGTEAEATANTATHAPSSSLAQRDIYAADNPSPTGFTVRALLYQVGTLTARTDNFTANELTTNFTAIDGQYTAHGTVDITGATKLTGPWVVEGTVAVDSDNGSGWVERATTGFEFVLDAGSFTESQPFDIGFTDSSLTAGDGIRVRLKDSTITGQYLSGPDPTVNGTNTTYSTAGASSYASKTPVAGTNVQWTSYGYL